MNTPCAKPILQGDRMYVRVLGCASAKPTLLYRPTAQTLHLRDKTFLIDCGEGTQRAMLQFRVSFANIHRIFLTHLHGDHCLGLPGLLSTMSLCGMRHPVHVYGPYGTAKYIGMILEMFCKDDALRIIPHELDHRTAQVAYEDRSVVVEYFPLVHRVPTIGYLFREQPLGLHLNREMADFYDIPPVHFGRIKQGEDYQLPDGRVVPNSRLTIPPRPTYTYAFCSDTAYTETLIPHVCGADLLYHEATFGRDLAEQARATLHSTSEDAARIALQAGVGHLLIGHYSGRYVRASDREVLRQECAAIFPNTLAAYDGLLIDFKELRNRR